MLVFEDLHWADDGLLDFVDHLVDWASGVPLLVVCTARPELLERRPGWGGGKRERDDALALAALRRRDGAARSRAARPAAAAGRDAGDAARARGRQPALRRGVRADARRARRRRRRCRCPRRVQGIIAARLDALSAGGEGAAPGRRRGRQGLLARRASRHRRRRAGAGRGALHALERKEFVRRERRSSVAGETEYAFRHVLVRDVAYGQIPRAARAEKHRPPPSGSSRSAGAEDHAEMLAHHYSARSSTRGPPGESDRRARDARQARAARGRRPRMALNAFGPRGRFYGEALELWPSDDPERPQLLFASVAHERPSPPARAST